MISALTNHLWQSTLFAIIVGLLTAAFRGNRAQVRYWLWFSASLKFLVPFSALVSLGSHLQWCRPSQGIATRIATHTVSVALIQVTQPFRGISSSARPTPEPVVWFPLVIVGIWACGLAVIMLIRFRHWLAIRAAVIASVPLEISGTADLRCAPGLLEPGVVGFLRPVVLLPSAIAERLAPAQLDAVLAHELCHIRRRDNLFAAIHMIVEAIYWFHPLVWWIGSRLIEEREYACDEEVLSLGSEPRVYAEGILNVCKLCIESPLACVPGVTGANLKGRIEVIMTNRTGRRLSRMSKLLLASAGVVAVAGPLVIGIVGAPVVRAQVPVNQPLTLPEKMPSFDVASVRPNKSSAPPYSNFPLNAGAMYTANGGLLSATNFPLVTYIFFAYNLMGNQAQFLVPQLPGWVMTNRFDIQARAAGSPTKDQMRLMMRSLLADRFKLAVHTEKREVPVLAFVLLKPGKTGPQLQRHPDDASCETNVEPTSPAHPIPDLFSQKVPGGFPAVCNSIIGVPPSVPGRSRLGGRNVTIGFMADMFSQRVDLGRPMIDATGLTGTFDFLLEFTPESKTPAPDTNTAADPDGPSFEQAVRDQLGLKFESRKSSMNVMVFDHVEHPSEN